MGVDRTIHLRPFIKIPVQYESYEQEIKTCGEHENNIDKFCPKCGKEITIKKIQKSKMIWCDDLIDNCRLWQYVERDTMYLFSNFSSKNKIDTEENIFTILTHKLIDTMIEEFYEKHENEIKLLEEKLNIKIPVEFGFLNEAY